MKKLFLLSFALLLCLDVVHAQTISGIINTYATVTHISANNIKVDNSTGFSVNDKVMIIQMKGAIIDTADTSTFGNILNYNSAGNYEFAKVVGISGNTVTLQYPLCRTYDVKGHVQLITVPVYNNVSVSDTLTCLGWNGLNGGILVFEASGTLTLNADINVTGKGFRGGANVEGGYNPFLKDWYLPTSTPYSSGGQKGEGITDYILDKDGGRGKLANGGGGSNPVQDGGGGGGNYGRGGLGGYGFSLYVIQYHDSSVQSSGGEALTYLNSNIFLGGGAGGGCADNGHVFTPGTNGGGLIIITAKAIVGNARFISANGLDNLIASADEGAGGGGAGGSVLLNVDSYNGQLQVQTRGGKGSDNDESAYFSGACHGTGGGGGAGILWLKTSSILPNINYDGSGGKPGFGINPVCTCYNTSWGATAGDTTFQPLFNLILPPMPVGPLSIAKNMHACSSTPLALNPSGKPAYTYSWTPSAGLNCDSCANPLATPSATTTYSVMGIDGFCSDSAQVVVTVDSVYHAGQITASRDTICEGTPANLTLSGNGSGAIQWKSSTSSLSGFRIINAADSTTLKDVIPSTSYFRVVVGTGQCADSTNIYKVVVAPNPKISYSEVASKTTVTYTADSGSGGITNYKWDFGDTSASSNLINPVHTYKQYGTYYVCLTVYNGSNCSYTYCRYIALDSLANGISTIKDDNIWKIYPDPANTQLFISREQSTLNPESIEVYDVLGQRVLADVLNLKDENPIKLDISTFADGMYYLKIKTSAANYIHSFVKQQ